MNRKGLTLQLVVVFILSLMFSLVSSVSVARNLGDANLGQPPRDEAQAPTNQAEINPLSAQASFKPAKFSPDQIVELEIKLKLSPEFKAYEDQFKVEVPTEEGFQIANFKVSPVEEFYDEFSKSKRKGVTGDAMIKAAVRVPEKVTSKSTVKVHLTYQACTKKFCLFPKMMDIQVPFQWEGTAAAKPKLTETLKEGFKAGSFEEAFNQGLLWTFVFVFFAGVLTSFTPCIFPMIPITLAVLSQGSEKRSRGQNFVVSLFYVGGIAITYALLGLAAASTGALFGSALSSPWVLGTICVIFLAMSLSLFGFYEIQPPLFIRQRFQGPTMKGPLGAFLTGAFSGIVASPCVGPVLVGILAYVAQSQNLFLGFWLLFVFALGMGQIFLALGLSTNLTKKLPRSGPWLNGVKSLSGLLMLGVFFYYLNLLLPIRYFDMASGIGLIALGSLGGAFLQMPFSAFQRLRKGFGMAAILFGAFVLIVGAFDLRPKLSSTSVSGASVTDAAANTLPWGELTPASLDAARKSGRPVLIDFYADWCAACHELDRHTFSQARVQSLAGDFTLLRFDATRDSEVLAQFKKEFGILGLPWVVFIDPKGTYRKDLTLTEFEEPVKFLDRMEKAKQ